jgi:hypothetical protein
MQARMTAPASIVRRTQDDPLPGGVTLKELAKLTGWQPNSVRGFLSGAIGKKMATPVESFKSSDGDRTYRLPSK